MITWPITIQIIDDDLPTISIAPESAAITEGQWARFTVTLSEALDSSAGVDSVPVSFRVEEQNVLSGTFLGLVPTSFSIPEGDTSARLSVPTSGDAEDESGGDLVVVLEPSPRYYQTPRIPEILVASECGTGSADGCAAVHVADDDRLPELSLAAPSGAVDECHQSSASCTPAAFTLKLTGASGTALTVDADVEHVADANDGAAPVERERLTYTFGANSTSQTIDVYPRVDADSADGRLCVTLAPGTGYQLSAPFRDCVDVRDRVTESPGNNDPTVTVAADDTALTLGTNTTVTATASDPDGDPLTYAWRVTGGQVFRDGPSVTFHAGYEPGTATITSIVRDGKGGSAEGVVEIALHHEPTVSLEATADSIVAGGGATITATASDPDGDELTYTWSVTGVGAVEGDGPVVVFTAAEAGAATITCTVTDGNGGEVSAQVVIEVEEPAGRPNRSPAVTLSGDDTAAVGEPVTVTATASDPDGDELTYSWSLEPEAGGLVEGEGASVTFTGAEPGAVTVTVVVTDGHGAETRASLTITVMAPVPALPPAGIGIAWLLMLAIGRLLVRRRAAA